MSVRVCANAVRACAHLAGVSTVSPKLGRAAAQSANIVIEYYMRIVARSALREHVNFHVHVSQIMVKILLGKVC